MKVRYCLDTDAIGVKKYGKDKDMKVSFDIPHNSDMPIFLDILEKNDFTYKVKMFFMDGEVIVGYIPHKFSSPIKLTNTECLFDGRFNS